MRDSKSTEPIPSNEPSRGQINLADVIDGVRDAVVCCNAEGTIVVFNRAASAMFGFDQREMLGRSIGALMPADVAENHQLYIAKFRASGDGSLAGYTRTVEAQRADGSAFPVELRVALSGTADNPLYTATLRDPTPIRRLEDSLQTERDMRRRGEAELTACRRFVSEAQRREEWAAFLAQLLHDLGNPVSGISAQSQLLLAQARKELLAPAMAEESLRLILDEVGRLQSQIRELANLSRRGGRAPSMTFEGIEVARSIVSRWEPLTTRANVSLGYAFELDFGRVVGDRERIERVIESLVKNAVEACADVGGGRVMISGSVEGDGNLVIEVSDDGPGLDSAIEPFRLFTTSKVDGSGLGLALARQLMQAVGGDIKYRANSPSGATFTIRLPYQETSPSRIASNGHGFSASSQS